MKKEINNALLKSRVKGSVNFHYFKDDSLWYITDDNWIFPIPISETGNSQGSSPKFEACMKGIFCMRWIRKHMKKELDLQ